MGIPRGRPEAIVRPRAGGRVFEVRRFAPSPALAELVDYYWLVRWHAAEPHHQQVVPQPRVHVAAEGGRLLVHGISREPFHRRLVGDGHVLGAAFHPGGFSPLLRGSVGAISGTVRPAAEVLGPDDRPAAGRILAGRDAAAMVAELAGYLAGIGARPDAASREATRLVAAAEADRGITRAEQLAAVAGVSLRSLQRMFTEHVGIGPKWIIQRFRVLDAAAAAHSGERVDWAGLAAELGFADQAHLTRVFAAVVGTPPEAYRRDPGTG